MTNSKKWQQLLGNQRDWIWRGWHTRYTYVRAEDGNNPELTPLILLHGFGASIGHWRHNLPALSQKHTVYALDLLGFGASKKAATDYTVDLWVQQVYDFWQIFIGKPVVLVGNSIGSLVCFTAAATYPEMVKGIVMISLPDVSMREEMLPRWLMPIVSTIEGAVASPPLLKTLFAFLRRKATIRRWAQIAYVKKEAITDELVDILATPPQDEGAARTFCLLFKAVRRREFAPGAKAVLPTLKIPMLLIWGKSDRMVPFSLAPHFAKLNPQIKLVELDNLGHCPHDECPDKFNHILLSWLHAHWSNP